MTTQITNSAQGKSKATLQAALNANPHGVLMLTPMPGRDALHTADIIKPGEQLAVVMDHPRRMRFALIKRAADGTFRVC
jgi:hypothetical protein